VLEKVVQKGYQTTSQIHRILDCHSFGGTTTADGTPETCTYEAKIKNLLQTSVTFKDNQYVGTTSAKDITFWRYRVGGEAGVWQYMTIDNDIEHSFKSPQTMIEVQAWTQCGMAGQFMFFVMLHLTNDIKVCDEFEHMWYQSTVSRLPLDGELCNYPHSDFVELTFDYHPNVGLQYYMDNTNMEIQDVKCWMKYDGKTRGEILHVAGKSKDIVERFAVELVKSQTTDRLTKVGIECRFEYLKATGTTEEVTCTHKFIARDCDDPRFEVPEERCFWDKCGGADQPPLPGPYETCGGNVVESTATGTQMKVVTGNKCCDKCDTELKCKSVVGLPAGQVDIKMCVPKGSWYSEHFALMADYKYKLHRLFRGKMLAGIGAVAGVVVGVAMLVVVRRREEPENDGYTALLG
jgi:hypothetical protein